MIPPRILLEFFINSGDGNRTRVSPNYESGECPLLYSASIECYHTLSFLSRVFFYSSKTNLAFTSPFSKSFLYKETFVFSSVS